MEVAIHNDFTLDPTCIIKTGPEPAAGDKLFCDYVDKGTGGDYDQT